MATVTVTALKFHSCNGADHAAGSTYDVEADQIDNLVAQGMVAAPEAPPQPVKPSQPVEPMTTDDFSPTKGETIG